ADWDETPAGVTVARRGAKAVGGLAGDHPLANLAGAMAEEIIEISVAARVDRPILIRRIAGPGLCHARLALSLNEGAAATIIESFDAIGAYFSNSLMEIDIAEGAALARLALQDGSDRGVETSFVAARLGARAEFRQTALLLGAKAARLETRIACEGDGAKISLHSASALSGARHADVTSHVTHAAEGVVTRQSHKSAIRDRARGVFQGKFLIARGAQKTAAQMTAKALLLSDAAEANHKPELEIYADDVQCAHGSTAGALDEDALFYLRQRGLDAQAARALLVEAFLNEAFEDIAHPGVHNVFHHRVMHWLGGAS
ncbi:MAG: Fe-S cluster assembly protein SufD, partial [Amphiplicatus sp.]